MHTRTAAGACACRLCLACVLQLPVYLHHSGDFSPSILSHLCPQGLLSDNGFMSHCGNARLMLDQLLLQLALWGNGKAEVWQSNKMDERDV